MRRLRISTGSICLVLLLAIALLETGCLRNTYALAGRDTRSREGRSTSSQAANSIVVDGHRRTFLIKVPPSYDPKTPVPLLLVFHGRGGNGQRIADVTQFDRLPRPEGTIVVYPDGYANSWADGRGDSKAEQAGIDDVAFVKALIDHLAKSFNIDERAIFAAGFSNGAIFSQRLACELSERVTAIAAVVGPITPSVASRCHPKKRISVLGIYGTKDPLNPWEGGDIMKGGRGPILSVQATIDLWGRLNGCQKPQTRISLPVRVHDGTHAWVEGYLACQEGVKVILHGVEGMGHAWPPRPPGFARITGSTSGNLDATQVIWTFFQSVISRSSTVTPERSR